MNDKRKYVDYLNEISEAYFRALKATYRLNNRKECIEFCKQQNKNYNPKDFKIEKNHELEEYFDKYFKALKKGKATLFTSDQLFTMNKKSKYWEIPNETDLLYFEVPSFNHRYPFFLWLIFAAVVVGVGAYGIYHHLKPGPTPPEPEPTVYEAEINEDPHSSFIIEGGGSLSNHKPGDVIEITFEAKGEAEEGYKYGLPLDIGEGLKVENAADATYKFDEETGKGKLLVTFGESDVNINFTALKYCISEDIDCILPINPDGEEQELMSFNEFRAFVLDSAHIRTDDYYRYFSCENWNFVLTQDVDFDNFQQIARWDDWPVRHYCSCSFNGNHKTIKIKNSNCAGYFYGLFGTVGATYNENPATFKDLNLYVDITSDDTPANQKQFMGSLIGYGSDNIHISNVNVFGQINSNRVSGGLIGSESWYYGENRSVIKIENCNVNADITAHSLSAYGSDSWILCGGIVGQSDAGPYPDDPDHIDDGLYINNCSYNGTLLALDNGATDVVSYMGYAMAKGGLDNEATAIDCTIINNFKVGERSKIEGFAANNTHNYPFEGHNNYAEAPSEYTYDIEAGPNRNKELIGGYFITAVIDGKTNPDKLGYHFPHGGETP